MLKRYAIKWQYLEPLRDYYPPFKCPLLYKTFGYGFGVANLLLQHYGEDKLFLQCRMLVLHIYIFVDCWIFVYYFTIFHRLYDFQ